MTIYFGLELDDLCFPKIVPPCGNIHYFGPQQLLFMLESHLGLIGHSSNNEYLRIEQYRQALLKHTEVEQTTFYLHSFQADQFATATELLSRRDELVLANWDFQLSENTPTRLKTMAQIEQYLKVGYPPITEKDSSTPQLRLNFATTDSPSQLWLSPGFADRFVAVLNNLPKRQHPIQKIYLNEAFEKLPTHFQQLIKLLKQQGVFIQPLLNKKILKNTDLGRFQQALRKELPRKTKFDVQADGSLLIIRSKRETDIAAYLAKMFSYNPHFRPICLVPEKSRSLDNALIQEGLPSMGILSASLARPTLQILKLAPVFLWRPIDPFKMMEFVSLAVKPLSDDLANQIAIQMAKTPGLNGEAWRAMIARYFDELQKKATTDKSIKVSDIRFQYEFWFERSRYDLTQSVPKSDAIEIFDYLARWAFQLFDDEGGQNNSILVLSEQAKRIKELLETLPETQLTNLELERIVRTIYEPSPVLFKEKEVGYLTHVHYPSAIIGGVKQLLWWNFSQNEPVHFFSRWYQKERTYLQALDIELTQPEDENDLLIWQRQRPILHAQDQLILVIPEMVEGEEVHPHTLSGDLEALFNGLNNITFQLDTQKGRLAFEQHFQLPELTEIPQKQLGKPRPFLQIKELGQLAAGDYETISSLESLFYYPYQWIFKHKLKLSKSSILSIVKDVTLMGNLSHRFFERMFRQDIQNWQKNDVEQWVDKEARTLLSREGAVLLMYGKEPEKVNFLNKVKYAAWSLVHLIQKNGWQVKGTEQDLTGRFMDIPIKGVADLVLEKAGDTAVVDLKWRGAKRRKEMINNQEDLQLVLYSKLLTEDDIWAHTSYFIIEKGEMIARNNLAFKEIDAVAADADHLQVNENIYAQMEATFQWRIQQIQEGKIEIRCEHTTLDLEDEYAGGQLMDILEMKQKDAPFDDYRTLINLIK